MSLWVFCFHVFPVSAPERLLTVLQSFLPPLNPLHPGSLYGRLSLVHVRPFPTDVSLKEAPSCAMYTVGAR